MWFIGTTCIATLVIIFATHYIYRWRHPKCDGVLRPPGSLGLPLIGETLSLMTPGYSLDIIPFLKKRIQRYGNIFKTNVAGRVVIVSADSKFSHFILQQDGRLFESWYLDTFAKIFAQESEGSTNIAYVHKYVRNTVLKHFGMEALRDKILPLMEEASCATLKAWASQESIEVKYATGMMTVEFGAKRLFSYDPVQSPEKLGDIFFSFTRGLMSIPLNIPGTTHYKCLQDHKKALGKIEEIVKKRISQPNTIPEDFLDYILADSSKEEFLKEDVVVQLFFGLLHATFDSLSSIMTLALILLEQHPVVLQKLTDEHERFLKCRENSSSITWKEYKSMIFTLQVIQEVLRLGNVSPGLFRRAKKDVEFNGYTIPAGWGILIATSALHLDPETYREPITFNPWRWRDQESDAMMKNFMPFGAGMKQCPGSEYSRVFLAAFLHVLVTKYRWTKVKGGKVYRKPMIDFGEGYHIKVMEKSN